MVRRQIGVAETRYRFGAATARIGRANASNHREQRDCGNFQHGYLFSCVSSRFRQDGEYRELNIGAKARNGSGDLMR